MISVSVLERRQVLLLTKTFFTRLFESELMPEGLPQVRLVIGAVSAITMTLTVVPVLIRLHATRLVAFQYTVSMIVLAFIALVIWEGIFPDRRDGRALSPLPIRTRTFVVARLGALAGFFGLFALGSAALPSLVFTTVRGNPVAHFLALVSLDAFAFFAVLALQCVLLNVIGRTFAQRLALVLQLAIVIAILQAPVLPGNPRRPLELAEVAWWLPSVWFVGLFDVLAGRAGAAARSLAPLAVASAAGLPLLTMLLYAATYRRLLQRAMEGEAPRATPRSVFARPRAMARRLIVDLIPNAVARAVCLFTLHTIARSRRHKMLLAMYLGVAAALILSVVVPKALLKGFAGFAKPDAALLSTPLVLMFLLLVGVRSIVRIPVEIAANWIFRLREPPERGAVIGGVAWAMTLGGVVPVTLLTAASAWILWGPATALRHGAFCGALGLLLTHVLLVTFKRFPFTWPYVPGSSRLRMLWPVYLTLFSTYSFTMGRLEVRLLQSDRRILAALTTILAATAVFALARRVRLRRAIAFGFNEPDPDALFEGFHLSEQLAAERARRRVTTS